MVKVYGSGNAEVHALRGVDLDVYPGELTMLVGPERLRQDDAALGAWPASCGRPAGTVDVLGTDLTRLSSWQRTAFRRENVGFVFQQFNLLPALTAAENVAVPLVIQGWSKRKAVARGEGAARKDGHGRSREQSAGQALRRPAAARGDRPGAGASSAPAGVRRADVGARRQDRATRSWNCCGPWRSKAIGP